MKLIRKDDRSYQAASHEDAGNPGVLKKVLLSAGDFYNGKPQMINWALLPAGNSFSPHYHEDMQEVFVIVRGTPLMEVGHERVELFPGDTIVVDAGEVHVMVNRTEKDVEYLVVGISGFSKGQTVVVNQS